MDACPCGDIAGAGGTEADACPRGDIAGAGGTEVDTCPRGDATVTAEGIFFCFLKVLYQVGDVTKTFTTIDFDSDSNSRGNAL